MAAKWRYTADGSRVALVGKTPKPKKITGTKFGAILGYNRWNTPFQMWCEITKAAKVPFEGNMYTEAGQVIEPKQIAYMKDYVDDAVLSPEEYYGNTWSTVKRTYDFFPDYTIFGGMWDAVVVDDNKQIKAVVECKTTKRRQDWEDGVPVYYAMQTALYAALLGVEYFYIIGSFVEDKDYAHPEMFEVTDDNTVVYAYRTSEFEIDGKDIDELIADAYEWHHTHISGPNACSPEFDEKVDKEYLKILRTTQPENDSDLDALVDQYLSVDSELTKAIETAGIKGLEKEKKSLTSAIKSATIGMFDGKTEKIEYGGIQVTQTPKRTLNKDRLAELLTDEQIESLYDDDYTYTLKTMKGGN